MGAIISDCGKFRYALWRGDDTRLAFVMLNPSTADAELDDPTIRRCMGFAKREGFGGIEVMNVYAFRATDPKDMLAASDPFGENIEYLQTLGRRHRIIVCAWGANAIASHAKKTAEILIRNGAKLYALGVTKAGQPKHPLYLSKDAPLIEWAAP